MKFFKDIILFFKNIFNKKENIKMLNEPVKKVHKDEGNINFKNSIRVNSNVNKEKKIETLTCYGDGLGIQKEIKY